MVTGGGGKDRGLESYHFSFSLPCYLPAHRCPACWQEMINLFLGWTELAPIIQGVEIKDFIQCPSAHPSLQLQFWHSLLLGSILVNLYFFICLRKKYTYKNVIMFSKKNIIYIFFQPTLWTPTSNYWTWPKKRARLNKPTGCECEQNWRDEKGIWVKRNGARFQMFDL